MESSIYKQCYKCESYIENNLIDNKNLKDECHVVKFPVDAPTSDDRLVFEDGEVNVYLCGECFEEYKNEVIKEYE